MQHLPDLVIAAGRFHPILLHFPIGIIAGVAALELWERSQPNLQLRAGISLLLALGSIGAVITAGSGLLLARSGGYDEGLLFQHRIFGVAAAVLSVAALLLHRRVRRSGDQRGIGAYRLTLVACVITIAGAGHYGGIITHGRKTPFAILAATLGSAFEQDEQGGTGSEVTATDDLADQSGQPILEARCYECHGQEKQKSGLRLDSREAAVAGGESGKPAIVPGNAMASRLVEAITLPTGNKRAMPPTGKRRLEPREVLTLINWINHGAMWPDKFQQPPEGVTPPSPAVLERLRAIGFHVSQLAVRHPLVRVDAVPKGARLAQLASIAANIAWLKLDGFELAAGDLSLLADMPHLARLELQRSTVQDRDLADVAKAPSLITLDLYATQIDDAGIAQLHNLRTLKQLYLWQTRVTPAGIQQLRAALPEAEIDCGDTQMQSADTDAARAQQTD